jgi:hypothetical protein
MYFILKIILISSIFIFLARSISTGQSTAGTKNCTENGETGGTSGGRSKNKTDKKTRLHCDVMWEGKR